MSRAVPQPTGLALIELIALIDQLRSPGGCPWDGEQTHASLVPYLTEEAHEAVEAIETGDRAAMLEELGDVLLQVILHARIAQEDPDDPWSIDEVAAGLNAKLISRHPHVFGTETVTSAAQVESVWLARKTVEKGRTSVLDGIPTGLPALLLAAKMASRAAQGGVLVQAAEPATRVTAAGAVDAVGADHVGELLLALVVEANGRGIDAESALRGALRGYAATVRAAETTNEPTPFAQQEPRGGNR